MVVAMVRSSEQPYRIAEESKFEVSMLTESLLRGAGTHHIDMHFYAMTPEERVRDAVCATMPCSASDPTAAKVFNFPPSQVIPPDFFYLPTLG